MEITGVGERFRDARKAAGMTQADVAKGFGCTQSLISAVENGDSQPSLALIVWLADKAGTSIDQIIVGREPSPPAKGWKKPASSTFLLGPEDSSQPLTLEKAAGKLGRRGDPEAQKGSPQNLEQKPFDRDLIINIANFLREVEEEQGVRIKPDKFGGLIMMIYDDEISGIEVPRSKIIQLVRLAA